MKLKQIILVAALLPTIAWAGQYAMYVPLKGLTTGEAAPTTPTTPPVVVPPVKKDFEEIVLGNLTLVRMKSMLQYTSAVSACASTINGTPGWKLVSQSEFKSVYAAYGAQVFAAAGYDMTGTGWFWNSDSHDGGGHLVWRTVDNVGSISMDWDPRWVVCSRTT